MQMLDIRGSTVITNGSLIIITVTLKSGLYNLQGEGP